MKTPPLLFVLLVAPLLLTGCVSSRYKPAPKDLPPAPKLDLAVSVPPLQLRLDSLIVYRGPGSWKNEAWWDEYVVTITNDSDEPVTIEACVLTDLQEMTVIPVGDPWELEQLSRARLKQLESQGRKVVLGTGLAVVWAASPALAYGAAYAGASTAAVLSTAVFVGGPVLLIGTGVRTHAAKKRIIAEFGRRRLPLPLTLAPHSSRTGSLFLPITPGPQSLSLRYLAGSTPQRLNLSLEPLAGLHLTPTENPSAHRSPPASRP